MHLATRSLLLAVFSLATTSVQAQNLQASPPDTEAPELVEFSFSPSSVDLAAGTQTVEVRARLSDVSRITGYLVTFRSPSGGQTETAGLRPESGSYTSGVWTGTATFESGAELGTWRPAVSLRDEFGNSDHLTADELDAAGFSTKMRVTEGGLDGSEPTLRRPLNEATRVSFVSTTFEYETATRGDLVIEVALTSNFSQVVDFATRSTASTVIDLGSRYEARYATTVTGLEPDQTYYWRVTNTTAESTSPVRSFTTEADAPPAFTSSPTVSATEGRAYSYAASATDPNGGAVAITSQSLPAWLTLRDTNDGTAILSGTPSDAEVGSHDIVLTASDGRLSVDQSFILVVSDVNNAPGPQEDAAETDEDTPVSVAVLANDADPDASDDLSVTAVSEPEHGSASVNDDGTVIYTPDADFNGTDSFTYTVDDGAGPVGPTGGGRIRADATATVTVTVRPVNDAPVFNSEPVTEATDGVLYTYDIRYSDVDNDLATLELSFNGIPWLGLENHGDGTATLSGTPLDPDAEGGAVERGFLTLTDGEDSTEQEFEITLTDVNYGPAPVADEAETDEDTPVIVAVLDNDAEDDNDTLTVTAVSNPEHGTAVINDDGTVTYTPDADFFGKDSFIYTVDDGAGPVGSTSARLRAEATATVTVAIAPVNDAPAASSVMAPASGATLTLPADGALSVSWSASTDVEDDPVAYRWELSASESFSSVLLSAETSGTSTSVSSSNMLEVLAAAGLAPATSLTVYHRVTATDGTDTTVGPTSPLVVERNANTGVGGGPVPFAVVGGHPNPTGRAFSVRLDLPASAAVRVEVFDMLGRCVATTDAGTMAAGRAQEVSLDLADIGVGTYAYRLTADLPGGVEVGTGRLTVAR